MIGAAAAPTTALIRDRAYRLSVDVAAREEQFGLLLYHYRTRRLVLVGDALLANLLLSLPQYPSLDLALAALVPSGRQESQSRGLARLVDAGMVIVA